MRGRRLLRLALLIITIVLALLMAGKLLWLPLAIVGPAGGPAFLGIATYVPLEGEGPFLSCIDPLRSGCEISSVSTKNSAYRVLIEIPPSLWLLTAIGVPAMAFLTVWILRPLARLALAMLALLLLVDLVAVSTLYVDQARIVYELPNVVLERVRLDLKENKVKISLTMGEYKLLSSSCEIEGIGKVNSTIRGSTVEIEVPPSLYESLYSRKAGERPLLVSPPARVEDYFRTSCNLKLDKGTLSGSYLVAITWGEPVIMATGSSVTIKNPNPIRLELIFELKEVRAIQVVRRERLTLGPLEERIIDVGEFRGKTIEIFILYSFLGSERGQRVELTVR